jgi:putative SOS response-associated peptidase YedK
MCGRVTIQTPALAIAREFALTGVRTALEHPRYNLAPTQLMPVVINDGERMLDAYRWGLIPSWAKEASIGS